jgi:DegV family protein with EDD domain
MPSGAALITDSSACIPAALIRRYRIRVVPIQVVVGDDEFRDGVNLDPNRLYRALERGLPVKSAAPTPLDYLDAIEAVPEDVAPVVLTPAAEFTRMHRNALLAAELSARRVSVVDSRSATAGHGLVVLAAAEAGQRTGVADDVVAAAEDAAGRAELVASMDSLEYLRQSGRLPAMALGLANHLGVRPVFRMRQGTAERLALPRTEDGALARVVKEWRAAGGTSAQSVAVFHAGRPERAAKLSALLGDRPSFITEFSAAMAIHTGPGVTGVAWLRAPVLEPDLPQDTPTGGRFAPHGSG